MRYFCGKDLKYMNRLLQEKPLRQSICWTGSYSTIHSSWETTLVESILFINLWTSNYWRFKQKKWKRFKYFCRFLKIMCLSEESLSIPSLDSAKCCRDNLCHWYIFQWPYVGSWRKKTLTPQNFPKP